MGSFTYFRFSGITEVFLFISCAEKLIMHTANSLKSSQKLPYV